MEKNKLQIIQYRDAPICTNICFMIIEKIIITKDLLSFNKQPIVIVTLLIARLYLINSALLTS